MARSYKRAIVKYAPKGNWGKKQANRKVRRTKGIPDGMAYKKVFDSWDVHDCSWDGRFVGLANGYHDYFTGEYIAPDNWISKKPNSKKINGCWHITK